MMSYLLNANGWFCMDDLENPYGPRQEISVNDRILCSALRIRMVEERIQKLYPEGDMRCPVHLSLGQELIAAAVCAALMPDDYVMSAHRSHAHYLARGGSLRAFFAELYGKETGCSRGKGGSMHLIDLKVNFLGCTPIVGAAIPIAVGVAFGLKLQNKPGRVVVFFGDAALETGAFHEAVNFSSLHELPVLFVCEDNGLSVNTTVNDRQTSESAIYEAVIFDDRDYNEVYDYIKSSRCGFMNCGTVRLAEHCGPKQIQEYSSDDQIEIFRKRPECAHLIAQFKCEIDDAVGFARHSAFPMREQMRKGVFAE
jgi:TPP-dependent pyruvate/acetoin dehydrogenase alpha subunit